MPEKIKLEKEIIDAPTRWLFQQIQQHSTNSSVWLNDENMLYALSHTEVSSTPLLLITNRWDVAEHAKQKGITTEFSDFDLSAIPDNSVDHVFYRISKEKAVAHHLINQAHRILQIGGLLWICGHKNEGIKTYIEKASHVFGCEKTIQKNGISYSSQIQKTTTTHILLNDENYQQLVPYIKINGADFLTKPGQFGWNKIDQGSEFLINEVIPLISKNTFDQCLDLGCGYGYLSIASQDLIVAKRTLTDNNAAALASAKANCSLLNIPANIIASDAGIGLPQHFDLILCNPPFHQGFSIDDDLTDKFLRSAAKLLSANGVAYFVVNQFIPLEKKARPYFNYIKIVAQNRSFTVMELRKI